MSARRKAVAVCGSGAADPRVAAMAREVGRGIVEAGCVLVCGGLGGVMEAAAQGGAAARVAGASGLVVGIVPGDELDGANPYCDVVIATGIGAARNTLVVKSADAVVLIAGGAGTLSEAALAWQLGKPLVALAPSGGWAERLAGARIDQRRTDTVAAAADAAQAVRLALVAAGVERSPG